MPILKQDELEDKVIELLSDKLLNSTEMDKVVKNVNQEYQKMYEDSFEEIKLLEKEFNEVDTELEHIVDNIAKGLASEKLLDKLVKLEAKKKVIAEQLRFNKTINKTEINIDDLKDVLKKDVNKLTKNVVGKEIIRNWVKNIEVYDKEIIVNFAFGKYSLPCLVARTRSMISYRIPIDLIRT